VEYWCQKANAKGSDASSPSGVTVVAENVKPSMFLLAGARRVIWPVKLNRKALY